MGERANIRYDEIYNQEEILADLAGIHDLAVQTDNKTVLRAFELHQAFLEAQGRILTRRPTAVKRGGREYNSIGIKLKGLFDEASEIDKPILSKIAIQVNGLELSQYDVTRNPQRAAARHLRKINLR